MQNMFYNSCTFSRSGQTIETDVFRLKLGILSNELFLTKVFIFNK